MDGRSMESTAPTEDICLLPEKEKNMSARVGASYEEKHLHSLGESSPETARAQARTEVTIDEMIESIGVGAYQRRMFLLCGLAFMADAVEVMILSFLQVLVKREWDLSSSGQATLTAIVFAGELFGALFWGPVADRYGRRRGYLYSTLVVAVCGVISAFSPSYGFLLVCRAMVGFGVAGLVIPFDLLAETLPPSQRGTKLMATNFFWTFGSIYVAVVAWLVVESVGWRLMALLASLPLVLAAAMFPLLPESPRWLLTKGRTEEAMDLMRHIAKLNKTSVPANVQLIGTQHEDGSYRELLSKQFRRTTTVIWMLWCGYGFTYYGLVLSMPRIFASTQDDTEFGSSATGGSGSTGEAPLFDYFALFISTSCEVLGVFIAMMVIDSWGRKWSQCILYVCAGIFMIPLCFAQSSSKDFLTVSAGIARAAIMGASCATWVATPEAYPTFIRATGHGFANAVARIGAGLTPYFCDSESLPISVIVLTYALVNVFIGFAAMLLPMETSGRDLDSIVDNPRAGAKISGSTLGSSQAYALAPTKRDLL